MQAAVLLSVLSAITSVSSLVLDVPAEAPQTNILSDHSASNDFIGSIYFMTNQPSGNFVVSASIGADGLLTPAHAISTGGIGGVSHAMPALALDPLFSEGPIAVHERSGLLATVNPGSNTIQLFAVDPKNPTVLSPIGGPAPAGGAFPTSVAFNNAGDMLCAINGAEVGCIQCYSIHPWRGLVPGDMRPLNLNQTNPPTGFANTTTTVRFTPDDTSVIVVVKGDRDVPGHTGFLMSWPVLSVSPATLSANAVIAPAPSIGSIPFSLSYIPGRRAFLVGDGTGVDVFNYQAGLEPGQITNKSIEIPGQIATCWSAYSQTSGNYYVADNLVSTVTEIHVDDQLAPSIARQYVPPPGNTGTNELAVATINGQDFLYLLLPNVTSIGVMRIDGPANGTFVQTLDFSQPAASVNLNITLLMAGLSIYMKDQTHLSRALGPR
ncbi:hypothetical protein K488DRAFT_84191 [Vararia minispora EC-137]|uniref:Uncharacterized protein n=1 Tax=Vararia minispora EC-137 TaxID=1314806 RepID=A0ACB8QRB0_9AGAM|nr:hypothetical protein K488DRAFT_84191 [Vararia minispora EC-137]